MNKTMHEINWHSIDDVFSHCTVTPITVIREGILPGCSAVSITAIDSTGYKFQGSPEDYYLTEKEAWEEVKLTLIENLSSMTRRIEKIEKQMLIQYDYLEKLILTK